MEAVFIAQYAVKTASFYQKKFDGLSEFCENEQQIIRISDIREDLYDANLDTEYREALAHSLMTLGYVSDTPLNLYYGTEEEKRELEKVEKMSLNSNQISEIIHLMMYEMRNDFQYERFKPVANKYIDISEKMRGKDLKTNSQHKEIQKVKCNIYGMVFIPEILGEVSKILKQNNMYNESRTMIEKATLSYSYDESIKAIEEYVEITKEREEEEEFE